MPFRLHPHATLPALALLLAGCLDAPPPAPVLAPATSIFHVTPMAPVAPTPPSPAADLLSAGGTLTFQTIGAAGWYPSRRDPASGQCDAWNQGGCCLAKHEATGSLAPWDEELILTLRGPLLVKTFAAWQPAAGERGPWKRVSLWKNAGAGTPVPEGLSIQGDGAQGWQGRVGNKCIVDLATDKPFPCGPGSSPFCPASTTSPRYGWAGSKLLLLEASMPHFGDAALSGTTHCSADPADNWYDAPWIGLSHGELIRSGKFGNCHCYSRDPSKWWLADGCGQFNVFEVVNDNNDFRNLDLFSTNLFAYHGYVGEGPCGKNCDLTGLAATADLVDKATSRPATQGATASPTKGPGAAFRRPAAGYRWFLVLMDAQSRTIQLSVFHPENPPVAAGRAVTTLPAELQAREIEEMLAMRLPNGTPLSIRKP